jgi:hypothetical protein
MRDDLNEIIDEWIGGGEIRQFYPSKTLLTEWIRSLPGVKASENTIRQYLCRMEKASDA